MIGVTSCSEQRDPVEGIPQRTDGSNPRKHMKKYPEEKRQSFLSAAELRLVDEVFREMECERIELASAILAVRLLIFAGCRLNEIMMLKWEHVDFADRVLRLPDSKTGAKVVHLGRPAIAPSRPLDRIPKRWTHFGDSRPLIDVIQAAGWTRRPAMDATSLVERSAPEDCPDGRGWPVLPADCRTLQDQRQLRHQADAAGASDR